jgi:hypothetical protein
VKAGGSREQEHARANGNDSNSSCDSLAMEAHQTIVNVVLAAIPANRLQEPRAQRFRSEALRRTDHSPAVITGLSFSRLSGRRSFGRFHARGLDRAVTNSVRSVG